VFHLSMPPGIRQLSARYKDISAQANIPSSSLAALMTGCLFGMDSVSDLVRACPWTESLSSLSDDLGKFNSTCSNRFIRRARAAILRMIAGVEDPTGRYRLAFDTTDNPRRISELRGVGHWASSDGSIFHGLNLVIVALVDTKTGVALPVAWAPCLKPVEGQKHDTAWEIVLRLLDELVAAGFAKVPVVGDSWFDGCPFMSELSDRGFTFVLELKSNRNMKTNISPNAQWHKAADVLSDETKTATHQGTRDKVTPVGLSGAKFVNSKIVFLSVPSGAGSKMRPFRIAGAHNYAADKTPFAVYITNDLSKPGIWLWGSARARWNIEVLFRDLKQNFSWGKIPCRSQNASDAFIVLPFIIVVALRLDDPALWGIEPRCTKTLGQMAGYVHESSLVRSIDLLRKNPNHPLIERFTNRRDPTFARKKPANLAAEERKFTEVAAAA
jgi:DDE superfamily endonuclease